MNCTHHANITKTKSNLVPKAEEKKRKTFPILYTSLVFLMLIKTNERRYSYSICTSYKKQNPNKL